MAQYNPHVIQDFADALYRQAAEIIKAYTIGGMVLGLVPGFAIVIPAFLVAGWGSENAGIGILVGLLIVLIGGTIGSAFGKKVGSSKAFGLKLKAQFALCQVQTELNTRSLSALLPFATVQDKYSAQTIEKGEEDQYYTQAKIEDNGYEAQQRIQEIQWKRRLQGVCTRCGQPLEPGESLHHDKCVSFIDSV